MTKYRLTLKPGDEIVEVDSSKTILEALKEADIYIKSSCGGIASCTDCVVKIISGEDHVSPPPFEEIRQLGNVFHLTKERLACQTRLLGDVTIDITKHDKESDEVKLLSKTAKNKKNFKTKIRKEEDVKNLRTEKEKEWAQKDEGKKSGQDAWKKHWEKPSADQAPKKLAGSRRPKFFDTDKVDYEKKDFSRPLSPEKQKLKKEREEALKDKVDQETESSKSKKDFKKFRE